MKYSILENLSITIKIGFLPLFDLGKPNIKSIDISTHGSLSNSKGVYKILR
jgi:hypothetical protein